MPRDGNPARVEAVLLCEGIVIAGDQAVPITNMFDIDGDETDDPFVACSIVAGPTRDGEWIACTVTDEETCVAVH